jgi:hypothetical protein
MGRAYVIHVGECEGRDQFGRLRHGWENNTGYDLEARKQYRIEIKNRFAALENASDDKDINRA